MHSVPVNWLNCTETSIALFFFSLFLSICLSKTSTLTSGQDFEDHYVLILGRISDLNVVQKMRRFLMFSQSLPAQNLVHQILFFTAQLWSRLQNDLIGGKTFNWIISAFMIQYLQFFCLNIKGRFIIFHCYCVQDTFRWLNSAVFLRHVQNGTYKCIKQQFCCRHSCMERLPPSGH